MKHSQKQRAEHIYNLILKRVENTLGNSTTYLGQLDEFMKPRLSNYRGTFPIDLIPNLKKNQSCIFNLDRSDQKGSHWCSMVRLPSNEYLVYDSFGRCSKKLTKDHLKHLKLNNTELDAEQTNNEKNCGARCCSFIILHDLFGHGYSKHI